MPKEVPYKGSLKRTLLKRTTLPKGNTLTKGRVSGPGGLKLTRYTYTNPK